MKGAGRREGGINVMSCIRTHEICSRVGRPNGWGGKRRDAALPGTLLLDSQDREDDAVKYFKSTHCRWSCGRRGVWGRDNELQQFHFVDEARCRAGALCHRGIVEVDGV